VEYKPFELKGDCITIVLCRKKLSIEELNAALISKILHSTKEG